MGETLPLATIQEAVLAFLAGKDDAILFGAQAVNAYVDEPRMTQDVDILSPRPDAFAEELRKHLNDRFHIAVRVREIVDGREFRLFQIQKPKNRHLVDVRGISTLPPTERIQDVLVVSPAELIASKVIAAHRRAGNPISFADRRDVAVLLLQFPDLKSEEGIVRDRLLADGAEAEVLVSWAQIVKEPIAREQDEDEF